MKFIVLIFIFAGLACSTQNKIFIDEDNINTSLDSSSSSSSSSSSLSDKNIEINNNLKLSELSIRSIKNIKKKNDIISENINNVIDDSVIDQLKNAKSLVKTPECQNHLNDTINGLKLSKQWAIASKLKDSFQWNRNTCFIFFL